MTIATAVSAVSTTTRIRSSRRPGIVGPRGYRGGMGDQLEMPGMPRRLFSATPSKLASFADCPRRYRFTYVDRPTPAKGPAWAHNTVGAAVHEL